MKSVAFFALFVALSAVLSVQAISLDRVHLVDYHPDVNSFLFRGNQPLSGHKGNWTFAYDTLVEYMRIRANETANVTLPPKDKLYILDITFENSLNSGFHTEEEFWKDPANAKKGEYMQWELLGELLHPSEVSKSERTKMVKEGKIWDLDKIPSRVVTMREEILKKGPPKGYDALAVYVHCQGGCDRTGEFIGSYRMAYQYAPTLSVQYELDCKECGRCPNWFATGGLGWYCETWNYFNSTQSNATKPLPDCLDAYKCSLLKHGQPCEATGK